ncbi:zinc-binding dehydrogenase [Lactonifactor longoviformis]|uniref:zinc-dependent alcohol dehydrogenase n=1 Tax=Lactonifactor longoviformis TaxID=341220 RepID=UPI0036F212D9
MKSLDAFMYGPKDLRLETVEVPELKPTQILVKVRASGICGSDVHCYLGESAEGRYDLGPYTPGHEWCGDVIAIGSDVISLKVGDRVTGECANSCNRCDICKEGINNSYCTNWNEVGFMPTAPGGMGQYLVGEEQFCYKVPNTMSYVEGALVEPCSVAYYSIYGRDGFVARTDDCVIFGAGPIGLFAATICKAAGAKVMIVDPVEFRRNLALEVIGVDRAIDPFNEDVEKVVMEETEGQGASFIVECTGTDACVGMTVDIAKPHARIRFIGHSIGRRIPIEIGKAIWKGLNLQGSAGQPWFFTKTIKFMNRVKKDIDYSKFVTGYYPLEKIQEAFDEAIEHKDRAIKIMITMDDEAAEA